MNGGSRSPHGRRNLETSEQDYKSGQATVLKVIEPVEGVICATTNYRTNRIVKQPARYDDYVVHKLHRMAQKTAVKMKDGTFSGRVLMSVFALLQDFKAACNTCRIYNKAAMWLFRR